MRMWEPGHDMLWHKAVDDEEEGRRVLTAISDNYDEVAAPWRWSDGDGDADE